MLDMTLLFLVLVLVLVVRVSSDACFLTLVQQT